MIEVTDEISLDDNEINMDFIRSSGPGGQNVNKVATAVQLRFDVKKSTNIPDEVKDRLIQLAGKRMTEHGILLINARKYRTQERNRKDAVERLVDLIKRASIKPIVRKATKPSLQSKLRRLERKRKRSKLKKIRQTISYPED